MRVGCRPKRCFTWPMPPPPERNGGCAAFGLRHRDRNRSAWERTGKRKIGAKSLQLTRCATNAKSGARDVDHRSEIVGAERDGA